MVGLPQKPATPVLLHPCPKPGILAWIAPNSDSLSELIRPSVDLWGDRSALAPSYSLIFPHSAALEAAGVPGYCPVSRNRIAKHF